MGDLIEGKLVIFTKDSVIVRLDAKPEILFQIQPSMFAGDIQEGLLLLTVGDSVEFRINADSLKIRTPLPEFVTEYLGYSILVTNLYTEAEFIEKQQQEELAEIELEKERIAEYLKSSDLKYKPTESGLYFAETVRGKGKAVKQNSTIKMNYVGRLLDGSIFDTSIEKTAQEEGIYNPQRPYEPMQAIAGVGQLIPGMDEALLMMREGSKATCIIPFSLGYGPQGAGSFIPPYATLIFEIEVTEVK